MREHFLLIVYDISNDRRRTRLHDLLLDYGTPVQYSVFECLLSQAQIAAMRKAIRKVIRPRVDQVRMYHLCEACAAKTEVSSGKEVLKASQDALIVGGDDPGG